MSDLILQAAISRKRLEAEQDVTRQWIERSQNQDKTIQEQAQMIEELKRELILYRMHAYGLVEQRDFLRADPANIAKSRTLTEEKNKDGSPKTFFKTIYDKAFDERGIELGITNPAEWRK